MISLIWGTSVQSLSRVWLFATPWTAVCQTSWSITTLGACSNSCPLSWWCHTTFCCPLLLLPSGFPSIKVFSNESVICIRWQKYWSFSYRANSSNEYSGWFPLGLTGLISLQFKGLARVFSNTTVKSINFSALSFFYGPTLTSIHGYWKNHSSNYTDLCNEMSLLFIMLSRS